MKIAQAMTALEAEKPLPVWPYHTGPDCQRTNHHFDISFTQGKLQVPTVRVELCDKRRVNGHDEQGPEQRGDLEDGDGEAVVEHVGGSRPAVVATGSRGNESDRRDTAKRRDDGVWYIYL